MQNIIRIGALAVACQLTVLPVGAADLAGHKTIKLVSQSGEQVVIGRMVLIPHGSGYSFSLKLATNEPFREFYMQDRNFRCLVGPKQHLCHLPRLSSGEVSSNDSSGLDYSLLFIHKGPNEVDLNPWNGIYYEMRTVGDHLEGLARDVDLSQLLLRKISPGTRPCAKATLTPQILAITGFPN